MGLECGMQYLRIPEMREHDDKTREDKSHNRRFGSAPDSAFLFCDKLMVLDHEENGTYFVCEMPVAEKLLRNVLRNVPKRFSGRRKEKQ